MPILALVLEMDGKLGFMAVQVRLKVMALAGKTSA